MSAPRRRRSLQLEERLLRSAENLHLGDVGGRLRLAQHPFIPTSGLAAGRRGSPAGVNVHTIGARADQDQSVDDQALVSWQQIDPPRVGRVGFSETASPTTGIVTDITGPAVISVEGGRWASYRSPDSELIVITDADGDELTIPLDADGQRSRHFFGTSPAIDLHATDTVGLRPNLSGSAQILADCRLKIEQIELHPPTSLAGRLVQKEVVWLNSRAHSIHPSVNTWVESTYALPAGVECELVVDGLFREKGVSTGHTILYPSPGHPSGEDGSWDAECYLDNVYTPPGHGGQFRVDYGTGWHHPEPETGHASVPLPGYEYTYRVVGQGQILKAAIHDTPISDNNGQLRIRIFGPDST